MHNLMIIGNLCAKPDLRYTPAGKAVCNFTVAVNKPTRPGQEQREAEFFNVSAWEKMGEACANLDKGSKVFVSGFVKARAYMTQNGEARASLDVTAREVEFLSRKVSSEEAQAQNKPTVGYEQAANKTEYRSEMGTFSQIDDEDLPF